MNHVFMLILPYRLIRSSQFSSLMIHSIHEERWYHHQVLPRREGQSIKEVLLSILDKDTVIPHTHHLHSHLNHCTQAQKASTLSPIHHPHTRPTLQTHTKMHAFILINKPTCTPYARNTLHPSSTHLTLQGFMAIELFR